MKKNILKIVFILLIINSCHQKQDISNDYKEELVILKNLISHLDKNDKSYLIWFISYDSIIEGTIYETNKPLYLDGFFRYTEYKNNRIFYVDSNYFTSNKYNSSNIHKLMKDNYLTFDINKKTEHRFIDSIFYYCRKNKRHIFIGEKTLNQRIFGDSILQKKLRGKTVNLDSLKISQLNLCN